MARVPRRKMLARRKGKAHSAARTSDSRNQSNRLLDNEKPVEVNDPPPSAKTDNLDGKLLPSISVECSTDPSNSSMLSPEFQINSEHKISSGASKLPPISAESSRHQLKSSILTHAESEHSYCASPDLTKTVLLDEPPKRVSTVGDISVTDLWLQVAVKLKLFLFHRWFVFVDKEALHVCYYSIQNALTVQRSLKVFESGAGEFYVHNQIVSLEEFTSDLDPPQPLSKDTVNSFVDRIASIVNCIRKKEVCTGYDDVKYRNAWFSCTVGEVDRNPFKECRYVETFRSFMCTRLIPNNKWRCGECAKMLKPLKRRSQSMAQDQANPNTKNIYLTEQQMLNKMQKQRSEINNAKKKIYRLQEKMQEILKKEGVPIDQSMSDAMLDILSQCEKLSPAQSIFLQQQIKASQQKHAAGMRWHPTIIRFALSLHLTSPAAYELMRETGMVKLPSSSTLFEYSHVKPVEEGVDKLVLESLAERVGAFQEKTQEISCTHGR